jgi:hypothetical protein
MEINQTYFTLAVRFTLFALSFTIFPSVVSANFLSDDQETYARYTTVNGNNSTEYLYYGSLGQGSDVWDGIYDETTDEITAQFTYRVPTYSGTGPEDIATMPVDIWSCSQNSFSTSTCSRVLFSIPTVWLYNNDKDVWYTRTIIFDVVSGTTYSFDSETYYFYTQGWDRGHTLQVNAVDIKGGATTLYAKTDLLYDTSLVTEDQSFNTPFMSWTNILGSPDPQAPVQPNTVGLFSDTETRFTDVTVSGTSTVNVEVDYYLDSNEVKTSISELNPTLVNFSLSLRPSTSFTTYGVTIDPETTGNQTTEYNFTSLSDGTYDLKIEFSNIPCNFDAGPCPFPDSYAYTEFTIASGTLESFGELELYDSQSFNDLESIYSPCGITQIDGCLKNVVVWAFVPGEFSTAYWQETLDYAETKTPFVYAFQFQSEMQELADNASGTLPTVSVNLPPLGNITLIDSAWMEDGGVLDVGSTLLYTLSAAAFYFSLAVVLWKRTKRFTYSLTQSQ